MGGRVAGALIAVVAATGFAAEIAAAEPVRPLGVEGRLGNDRLSDEKRVTRLAHAFFRAPIHVRPSSLSRVAGRLRLRTEDGPPEVYLVLRSRHVRQTGRTWLKIRIPGRPNGRKGWVRRAALGPMFGVRTRLVVNRR